MNTEWNTKFITAMQELCGQCCACGCGRRTVFSPRTHTLQGIQKGQPRRFVHGHNHTSTEWKNETGRYITKLGYIQIKDPIDPRADKKGWVLEHLAIARKALGKTLPENAVVHHVDENGTNNTRTNLVLCEDQVYHFLLHIRQRARKASGHAHWRKCSICKKHDAPTNLVVPLQAKQSPYHKHCNAQKESRRVRTRTRKVSTSPSQAGTEHDESRTGEGY